MDFYRSFHHHAPPALTSSLMKLSPIVPRVLGVLYLIILSLLLLKSAALATFLGIPERSIRGFTVLFAFFGFYGLYDLAVRTSKKNSNEPPPTP
jgi:hypothetical protein